jgi:hypothetical protein
MLADFVVLDRDITTVLPPKVLETRVLRTVSAARRCTMRSGQCVLVLRLLFSVGAFLG